MAETPPTPWQQAQAGRRAAKSETKGAKDSGGRRQPASGSKWYAKGDFRAHGALIEDKFTDANSFRLEKTDIQKIVNQGMATPPGLRGQMRININGLIVRVLPEDDYLYMEAMMEGGET